MHRRALFVRYLPMRGENFAWRQLLRWVQVFERGLIFQSADFGVFGTLGSRSSDHAAVLLQCLGCILVLLA